MDSTKGGRGSWAFCAQSLPDGTGGRGGAPVCLWFIANLPILFVRDLGGEKR